MGQPEQAEDNQVTAVKPTRGTGRGDWSLTVAYRHLLTMMPVATVVQFILSVTAAIIGVAVPLLLGRTVAALSAGGRRGPLIWALVLVLALLVAEVVSSVQSLLQEFMKRRIEKDAKLRTGLAFVRGPSLRSAEKPDQQGTAKRILESMWNLAGGLVDSVTHLPQTIVALIGSTIAVGVVFSWPFAAGLCLAVIVQAVMNSRVVASQLDLWGGMTEAQKHAHYAADLATDTGAKELRIFGLNHYLVERYTEHQLTAMRPWWRRRWAYSGQQTAVAGLRVAIMVGALAWAAHLVQTGRMDVGQLTATAALILAFGYIDVWGVATLTSGARRVKWLEEISPRSDVAALAQIQVREDRSPAATINPAPQITFDEVSFAYPSRPDRAVLQDLTWQLPAGEATALVGVNGAGKSTLVKLLTGGHRPTRGQILVDGVNLARLTDEELSAWQRRIAPITQDFLRLPLAAGDNVNLGSGQLWSGLMDGTDRPHSALDQLAQRAGLVDLIERLPQGWATVLDKTFTGGTDLSGGEWQRIGLARALRAVDAGAGLLVLDEPAAALDVESESRLVNNYLDLAARATSLLISHRFSVVRPVPHIAVLDGGQITETGDHESLMAAHGEYARLFAMQASRYLDEPDGAELDDRQES